MVGDPVIGIVIVTHGRLAEELIAATEHVVGPQTGIRAISIGADDDMDQRRKDIVEAVGRVEAGSGVIVLTDMFGGTPSNLAISIMEGAAIEVVSGVNLPMLIKLASARESEPLLAAALAAQEAGRRYISVASQVLGDGSADDP